MRISHASQFLSPNRLQIPVTTGHQLLTQEWTGSSELVYSQNAECSRLRVRKSFPPLNTDAQAVLTSNFTLYIVHDAEGWSELTALPSDEETLEWNWGILVDIGCLLASGS